MFPGKCFRIFWDWVENLLAAIAVAVYVLLQFWKEKKTKEKRDNSSKINNKQMKKPSQKTA